MTIFCYGRGSISDPAALGKRAEIAQAGYQVDYWHADANSAAASLRDASGRPQFAAMLAKTCAGDTLVVARLSCLGGDTSGIGDTLRLLEAHGVDLVVLQFGAPDFASAARQLLSAILVALAEIRDENPSVRTPGRPRKTTAAQRAEIIAMHRDSVSISQLSRQYGVSRLSIARIVREAGGRGP